VTDKDEPIAGERSRDLTTMMRLILAGLLAVLLLAFAIDNRGSVRVGWVVGDGKAPMIVVLLMAAVLGAAIGWLVLHATRRSGRRNQRNEQG
jgi:uncharacterized integral membrane protein